MMDSCSVRMNLSVSNHTLLRLHLCSTSNDCFKESALKSGHLISSSNLVKYFRFIVFSSHFQQLVAVGVLAVMVEGRSSVAPTVRQSARSKFL